MAARRRSCFATLLTALVVLASMSLIRAEQPAANAARLSGRVMLPAVAARSHPPAIVVWLTAADNAALDVPPPGRFKLIQKNRTFRPHLLVVPVGSVVSFPNKDPFFHNVFSLFNGKRFDLGLYEAGSSREIKFSREGVSYIFCNIHPEMSAVIIALATPLFAVADSSAAFTIQAVPSGTYNVHVWMEGAPQPDLNPLDRRIVVKEGQSTSLIIDATHANRPMRNHLNMYGKPYPPEAQSPY